MVEELKQRLLEYKIIEEERQEISTQVTEKNIEDEYDIELETWEIRYSATCSVTLLLSSFSPLKIICAFLFLC